MVISLKDFSPAYTYPSLPTSHRVQIQDQTAVKLILLFMQIAYFNFIFGSFNASLDKIPLYLRYSGMT